jgi:hypothetical protein
MAAAKKTKRTKRTKFSVLKAVKGRACKRKATQTQVKKAASDYVKDAVKKGKTKKEAQTIANRVVKGSCTVTAKVAGRKKRKRKPAKRRARR